MDNNNIKIIQDLIDGIDASIIQKNNMEKEVNNISNNTSTDLSLEEQISNKKKIQELTDTISYFKDSFPENIALAYGKINQAKNKLIEEKNKRIEKKEKEKEPLYNKLKTISTRMSQYSKGKDESAINPFLKNMELYNAQIQEIDNDISSIEKDFETANNNLSSFETKLDNYCFLLDIDKESMIILSEKKLEEERKQRLEEFKKMKLERAKEYAKKYKGKYLEQDGVEELTTKPISKNHTPTAPKPQQKPQPQPQPQPTNTQSIIMPNGDLLDFNIKIGRKASISIVRTNAEGNKTTTTNYPLKDYAIPIMADNLDAFKDIYDIIQDELITLKNHIPEEYDAISEALSDKYNYAKEIENALNNPSNSSRPEQIYENYKNKDTWYDKSCITFDYDDLSRKSFSELVGGPKISEKNKLVEISRKLERYGISTHTGDYTKPKGILAKISNFFASRKFKALPSAKEIVDAAEAYDSAIDPDRNSDESHGNQVKNEPNYFRKRATSKSFIEELKFKTKGLSRTAKKELAELNTSQQKYYDKTSEPKNKKNSTLENAEPEEENR